MAVNLPVEPACHAVRIADSLNLWRRECLLDFCKQQSRMPYLISDDIITSSCFMQNIYFFLWFRVKCDPDVSLWASPCLSHTHECRFRLLTLTGGCSQNINALWWITLNTKQVRDTWIWICLSLETHWCQHSRPHLHTAFRNTQPCVCVCEWEDQSWHQQFTHTHFYLW